MSPEGPPAGDRSSALGRRLAECWPVSRREVARRQETPRRRARPRSAPCAPGIAARRQAARPASTTATETHHWSPPSRKPRVPSIGSTTKVRRADKRSGVVRRLFRQPAIVRPGRRQRVPQEGIDGIVRLAHRRAAALHPDFRALAEIAHSNLRRPRPPLRAAAPNRRLAPPRRTIQLPARVMPSISSVGAAVP